MEILSLLDFIVGVFVGLSVSGVSGVGSGVRCLSEIFSENILLFKPLRTFFSWIKEKSYIFYKKIFFNCPFPFIYIS